MRGRGIYRGAVFEHAGERWIACGGKQRPSYARLLDATSCFMSLSNAVNAVAFLEPAVGYTVPNGVYHSRFVSAAWHGLGTLWAPVTPELAIPGPSLEPLDALDPELVEAIRREVLVSATTDWFGAKSSRQAERYIEPVLAKFLRDRGYVSCPREFASYWRNGATDGAWKLKRGKPRSIALEVKVNEDVDAPFGQIVDDLGAFDAVVHVRILKDERTRSRLFKTPGLDDIRARFSSLPVITITLRACAICGSSTEFTGESYPHLVCGACDSLALTENGRRPAVDPTADTGENPVFVVGRRCWRRYRFGGWLTMADPDGVASLEAYYEKHMGS